MIEKMTDEQYFAMDGISNSYISQFLRCPAATKIKVETTPAMAFGSAVHCAVLEGMDEFGKRYAVQTEKYDKRTKDGKAAAEEFARRNAGRTIISLEDFERITGILQSVIDHPAASENLRVGKAELAITWEDTDSLLQCKAKADWLDYSGILIDLKTTASDASNPAKWFRKMLDMNYHRQMAFYADGVKANGFKLRKVLMLVVDTTAPYAVGVYSLHEGLLEEGRQAYKHALKSIISVQRTQKYPAYTDPGIVELTLPKWMQDSTQNPLVIKKG